MLLVVGVNQLGVPVEVLVNESDHVQLENFLDDADLFRFRERLAHEGGVSLFDPFVDSSQLVLI